MRVQTNFDSIHFSPFSCTYQLNVDIGMTLYHDVSLREVSVEKKTEKWRNLKSCNKSNFHRRQTHVSLALYFMEYNYLGCSLC